MFFRGNYIKPSTVVSSGEGNGEGEQREMSFSTARDCFYYLFYSSQDCPGA